MSGHAFWGHDIGGFHGSPSAELYVRWAQFGLLSPLSRMHGDGVRVPWQYGEEATVIVRRMAEVRYALHPYLYAAALDAVTSAVPIMRPMPYQYPALAEAMAADLQYLLGRDVLVAPVYRPGGRRPVWFPPGRWAHYANGTQVEGPVFREVSVELQHAPMWLKGGSVVPLAAPSVRIGDGAYAGVDLAVVVGDDEQIDEVELKFPSLGGRVVVVEPAPSGDIVVSTPGDMPPITVSLIGAGDRERLAIVNGRSSPARRRRGLLASR